MTVTMVVYGKLMVYVVVCSGMMFVQVPVERLVVLHRVGVAVISLTVEGNDPYRIEEAQFPGSSVKEPYPSSSELSYGARLAVGNTVELKPSPP